MQNSKCKIIVAVLASLLLSMGVGSAQYYDNGASPHWLRWQSIEGDSVRVIAPDLYEGAARRALFYADSTRSSVDYGLGYGLGTVPLVIHPLNSLSNGLSIWAPRRVEISGMPSIGGYATTWLRHLAVHEMRHTAQYAALNRNTVRGLYYLLGEQGLLLASGLMPFWWIEGDATDAETQLNTFGRALQPSFTMHYRAVGRDILEGNIDPWFSGSYTMEVPSHYELGYQLVTTANTLADRYVWADVVDYASRHPYTIFATEIAMRRRLGHSTTELFRATFERLNDHWDSLPERHDSATKLDGPTPSDQYVTYQYPLWADSNTIVALRTTLDSSTRFVAIDATSGTERELFAVGYVSTRPALVGDRLYWTEHTQLSSFAQDMGSVLWSSTLDGREKQNPIGRKTIALYPTDFGGQLAYVRYNPESTYTIVCPSGEHTLPEGVEVHGLAADGQWLYYLTTEFGGMAIWRIRPTEWQRELVKHPSATTLSHLVTHSGKLYFGSIGSGYDEVHCWDIASSTESRLTTSQYGSFWGSPSPDGTRLALATYDRRGYHPAVADNISIEQLNPSQQMPLNVVNPPVYEWADVVKVDKIEASPMALAESEQRYPAKRYPKGAHLLNIHSWAPVYFRPDQVMSGNLGDVGLGVSVVSQNLLNTALTTIGYRYDGRHNLLANFKYVGLPVKLELGARVDNGSVGLYPVQGMIMENGDYLGYFDHTEQIKPPVAPRGYASVYAKGSLPLILGHSHWTTVVTPTIEISATNNMVYNPDRYKGGTFRSGMVASAATLQWNSYTRQAKRNLQPRWGIAAIAGVGKALTWEVETPLTVGLYGRVQTPGLGLNDGFTLRASYQNILGNGPVNYAVNLGWMSVRGAAHFEDTAYVLPDNQVGASVEYCTPLCYPNVGLEGIVLLKRLSLSLFGETLMAGANYKDGGWGYKGPWSVGANLVADTAWLRLPEQGDLGLRLSCYFVSGHLHRPVFSAGASVAF